MQHSSSKDDSMSRRATAPPSVNSTRRICRSDSLDCKPLPLQGTGTVEFDSIAVEPGHDLGHQRSIGSETALSDVARLAHSVQSARRHFKDLVSSRAADANACQAAALQDEVIPRTSVLSAQSS